MLGMSRWTLRSWYRGEMAKKRKKSRSAGPLGSEPTKVVSQEERIRALEKELKSTKAQLARSEEEKLILKKAAAFFAKEST